MPSYEKSPNLVAIDSKQKKLSTGKQNFRGKHLPPVLIGLIGITPQGTISFVSNARGGRTSDKFLTENCGILGKLKPGDFVMADRGFTIQESVWFQHAELAIPAFTKGKDQLDPIDVEKTRGIANVRIMWNELLGFCIKSTQYCKELFRLIFYLCLVMNL